MSKEKLHKIRMNCVSFVDVAVLAKTKKEAKEIARKMHLSCNSTEFEFGEFLEFDKFEAIDMAREVLKNNGSAEL